MVHAASRVLLRAPMANGFFFRSSWSVSHFFLRLMLLVSGSDRQFLQTSDATTNSKTGLNASLSMVLRQNTRLQLYYSTVLYQLSISQWCQISIRLNRDGFNGNEPGAWSTVTNFTSCGNTPAIPQWASQVWHPHKYEPWVVLSSRWRNEVTLWRAVFVRTSFSNRASFAVLTHPINYLYSILYIIPTNTYLPDSQTDKLFYTLHEQNSLSVWLSEEH